MTTNESINIIPPLDGSELLAGIRCKIASDATNNAYTVLEVTLQPTQGAGLHMHHRETEVLLVQTGTCIVGNAEQQWTLESGGMAQFPKQTPHFFRNDSSEPCVLLITAIPGGLDRYFADVAQAVADNQPERIPSINQEYEIVFL